MNSALGSWGAVWFSGMGNSFHHTRQHIIPFLRAHYLRGSTLSGKIGDARLTGRADCLKAA